MVHYLLIYVALQKSSSTNILPEQQSIVLQTRRERNHRDNEISGGSLRRLEKLKMIAKTRIKRNTKKKNTNVLRVSDKKPELCHILYLENEGDT